MSHPDVIVAGGGVAGIAAALRLAERGARVTLLETRRKLGGRATSFVDVRSGETLDNCQHVVLGCCTAYMDLLRRLGVAEAIEWHDRQYWVEPGGRTSVIEPDLLPAPLHFAGAVLRASFLTMRHVFELAGILPVILRAERSRHVAESFGRFLRRHGQSESLIERFWAPVVVSACNLPVDRVAASSALHVFQEGFFAHRHAARLGISRIPLIDLYDRAEAMIRAAGGHVRLGCSVDSIEAGSVLIGTGEVLSAGRVVCALPVERAREVIAPHARDERQPLLERFTFSPILGVHLVFDRPVLALPHAVLVGTGTQWLFRKDSHGCRVHAVISAADDWMPLSEAEIGARVEHDIRACFPNVAGATLVSVRPVKEKRATFAPTSEVENDRPLSAGTGPIILAGDYTRTGWPATMEGAARSGDTAAALVLGDPNPASPPPLVEGALVRLLRLGAGA
ncbi:MAG: hydroxysqualene dehydroxylase HpnE [Phycisphaerales bacterium]